MSGGGTNLQAVIDACEAGRINARVAVVMSNKADAYALERASAHGIPAEVIRHRDHSTRGDFEKAMIEILEAHAVELVCLAGFMRLLSPVFIGAYRNRIMNIHPALLPSFPGLHVQQKAVEHGVKFSGCTVHFVDEGTDTGPIIIQAVVPILDDDTAETLAERILVEEHKVYPRAIELYAQGRLRIEGRRVVVMPRCQATPAAMSNPPIEN